MLLSLDGGSDGNHSGPGPANTAANESLVELMRNRQEHRQAARAGVRQRNLERLQQHQKTESYLKYMYRRWRPGDVYAPHDLSPGEMHKFRKMTRRHVDLLDVVNVNPVDEYRVCGNGSRNPHCPRNTRVRGRDCCPSRRRERGVADAR